MQQGDGTAAILATNPNVFTLSVHAQSNFPARKQVSSLDVGLPDNTTDDDYMAAASNALVDALAKF